ncbi:hypothetical protein [Methylobacterium sp. J-092]|uniref:DUF6414 family protein n=1 Tax=Methylobacterium sp. J-092 TaxID=2836667 RepID=UPI001FB92640|nr:hypothetical protein [Methylobacterium sp. J-092]MCJ2009219.1 hypothetical protein [Methylobacterium sp. J-092]
MPSGKTSSAPETSDETQTSEERDYEEHSGDQPNNSVYDFLYQDVRRVGSFLAQFEEYGVRQAVKATESVGQTQALKGAASGTIGLPSVMGGSASMDTTTTDETKDIAEHTFDPLWANARRLLDFIESGDHIQHNLWEGRVGSFVQINGSIAIVDLNYIQTVLKNQKLSKSLLEGFAKAKGVKFNSTQAQDFHRNMEMVVGLPHGIQLTVFGDGEENNVAAWSSISHESLTTTAADIMLKHGIMIRGFWKVIGILDAFPDVPIPTEAEPNPQTLDQLAIEMIPKEFTKIAANLAAAARELIGRPRTMFGVTPILIFREVKKSI